MSEIVIYLVLFYIVLILIVIIVYKISSHSASGSLVATKAATSERSNITCGFPISTKAEIGRVYQFLPETSLAAELLWRLAAWTGNTIRSRVEFSNRAPGSIFYYKVFIKDISYREMRCRDSFSNASAPLSAPVSLQNKELWPRAPADVLSLTASVRPQRRLHLALLKKVLLRGKYFSSIKYCQPFLTGKFWFLKFETDLGCVISSRFGYFIPMNFDKRILEALFL